MSDQGLHIWPHSTRNLQHIHCNIDTMCTGMSTPYSNKATKLRLENHHHENYATWNTTTPLQCSCTKRMHMKLLSHHHCILNLQGTSLLANAFTPCSQTRSPMSDLPLPPALTSCFSPVLKRSLSLLGAFTLVPRSKKLMMRT